MPVQIVKKHDKVCRCRTGTDYLQVSAACLTAPLLHDIKMRLLYLNAD